MQQANPVGPATSNRVQDTAVGEPGRRQTRDDSAFAVRPMLRVTSRLQNRVQLRVRNRIDRDYDPQKGVDAPFLTAENETRAPGRLQREAEADALTPPR